jgi:hypothetical protein
MKKTILVMVIMLWMSATFSMAQTVTKKYHGVAKESGLVDVLEEWGIKIPQEMNPDVTAVKKGNKTSITSSMKMDNRNRFELTIELEMQKPVKVVFKCKLERSNGAVEIELGWNPSKKRTEPKLEKVAKKMYSVFFHPRKFNPPR